MLSVVVTCDQPLELTESVSPKIPKEFLARLRSVTAKRARTVIDHILEHGSITTEELKEQYGYNHPPRAAQDVRDQGIPIQTFKVVGKDGRSIAAYRFNLARAIDPKRRGRRAFPKLVKEALLRRDGSLCSVCGIEYDSRFLQVDHRVPYQVAGESLSDDLDQLMLVCGSCNRSKSWSCEHCVNWLELKQLRVCHSCYWANPQDYEHAAMVQIRRIDVAWRGPEITDYNSLRDLGKRLNLSMSELVKMIVRESPMLKK